jgi:hypothetical protein
MNTSSLFAAGLLIFALAPASCLAQDQPATPLDNAGKNAVKAEDPITEALLSLKDLPADVSDTDLAAVKAVVEGLRQKLETAQRQYDAGVVPMGELTDAKLSLSIAEAALERTKASYGSSQRTRKLASPVDVQVKDATVEITASALSRGSGVPIRVGPSVPKETRVTLDARRVALSTVLEAIARQADLLIVPDGDGVLLEPRPSLSVNGESQINSIRNWPWSSEWGVLPPGAGGLSGFAMPYLNATTLPKMPDLSKSYTSLFNAPALEGRVAVTSLQNRIVVAEPGVSDSGEQGTWLTVFRLEGDKLTKVGSAFLKAHTSSTRLGGTRKPAK